MIVDRELISKIEAKALVALDEAYDLLINLSEHLGEVSGCIRALLDGSEYNTLDFYSKDTKNLLELIEDRHSEYKKVLENILCDCGLVISNEGCKYCILCQDEEITRESNDCGCEKCNNIQKVRIKQEKQRLMRLEKEKLKIDPSH